MLSHQPYKFTSQEYVSLYEKGILGDLCRTELIDGEIFSLSPLGLKHRETQDILYNYLKKALSADGYKVRMTGSVYVNERSMIEPDVCVLSPEVTFTQAYLTMEQLHLGVEIADTTLDRDIQNDGRGKLSLYASGKVPVVWVVDVNHVRIYEFANASEDLLYTDCHLYKQSDLISVHNTEVVVSDLVYQM